MRDHYPTVCPTCIARVAHLTYDTCLPTIQYVWEIPIVRPSVTAHHYHTLCCRGCGALVTAPCPPDVPPGAFSPRTAAIVSMLRPVSSQ